VLSRAERNMNIFYCFDVGSAANAYDFQGKTPVQTQNEPTFAVSLLNPGS
jgi:hypothetical protein